MTAAEIRAFNMLGGQTVEAIWLQEIAAQLAELNALLRDVADHILPWERR